MRKAPDYVGSMRVACGAHPPGGRESSTLTGLAQLLRSARVSRSMGATVVMLSTLVAACGGRAAEYASGVDSIRTAGGAGYAVAPAPQYSFDGEDPVVDVYAPTETDEGAFGGGADWSRFEGEPEPAPPPAAHKNSDMRAALLQARQVQAQRRLAQADTRQSPPDGTTGNQGGQGQEATDAVAGGGPLLIYTADLTLAVYEVTETQDAILGAVREMNGFLASRNDHQLIVRVPADKFEEAMAEIEGKGDVLHRNVSVQDVSEEFRDVAIRIRNSEVMRDRLEALLSRADDVESALAIERELQRLTDLIERLKGRQRFLADRIAFSTITINFSSRATESAPDEFRLPFDWLNELGIRNLLTLR